jgi:hypothetical protein
MPKADCATIVGALTDSGLNFFGSTAFFSNAYDKVASFVTTLEPLTMNTSWQGLTFSLPFSIWGAYGAYGCHIETGKASQNLEKINNELEIAGKKATEEPDLELGDAELQQKSKEELIDIIKELQILVKWLTARKDNRTDEEKEAAEDAEAHQNTPLTFHQKYIKIGGEYLAHSAGFTGAITSILYNFWIPDLPVNLALHLLLLAVGAYSAKSDARNAARCMRINNLRDNLQRHTMFNQAPQLPAEFSAQTVVIDINSEPYHELSSSNR